MPWRIQYFDDEFGSDLDRVRKATQKLARAYKPRGLAEAAYLLYEQFWPNFPAGVRGWGASGELDLGLLARRVQRRTA
jgi:hypothetical protein